MGYHEFDDKPIDLERNLYKGFEINYKGNVSFLDLFVFRKKKFLFTDAFELTSLTSVGQKTMYNLNGTKNKIVFSGGLGFGAGLGAATGYDFTENI